MPKRWPHPSEQLTHGQHGCANPRHGAIEKKLQIITYAWSQRQPAQRTYGLASHLNRGRIYTTMLGHTWLGEDNPNLRCIGFRTLFARGVEWAATCQVSIPVPANVPVLDSDG